MNRKISFSIDEYYHIYNRGTDKRAVFLNEFDYERFIRLLYLCNTSKSIVLREIPIGRTYVFERGETLVDIGAYCLMSNHFHLLIREKIDGGIPLFMKKISTAYSMYFNIKNKRSGHLFEDIFKATHANSDEYLRYLFAYIHLNPVKLIEPEWKIKGIKDVFLAENFLKAYQYSSYVDFQDIKRDESKILNQAVFPEYFMGKKDFNDYLKDWLNFQEFNNTKNPAEV